MKGWYILSAKELKSLVAWCATIDSKKYRCNLSLFDYVHNAQIYLKMPAEHRIHFDLERDYTNIILTRFVDNLVQDYFNDKIEYNSPAFWKSYSTEYGDLSVQFFMFQLYRYLSNHECSSSFLGYDMHSKTIKFDSNGTWGGLLYDATYELSQFGMVFIKLQYTAYLVCKKSDLYSKNMLTWKNEDSFIEILSRKQIDISRG